MKNSFRAFPQSSILNPQSYPPYLRLMRLHRPIGILLLLWPVLWALWIASQGHPNFKVLSIMVLGVIVMRAAGCVINDIADRDFDGKVTRTKDRPLITGEVSTTQAIILFIFLMSSALGLVLLLNRLTIYLAFAAAFFAILYPFTKRFFVMPQLILGVTFNWGVPMAFAAQTNNVSGLAWIIYLIAVVWTIIYDTMYAMADKEDDIKIGIKSSAIAYIVEVARCL